MDEKHEIFTENCMVYIKLEQGHLIVETNIVGLCNSAQAPTPVYSIKTNIDVSVTVGG